MIKRRIAEKTERMDGVSIIWTLCVQIIDNIVVFF
jgi:hypothetical protein